MKRTIVNLAFLIGMCAFMTSCYTLSYSVGNGAQKGIEIKEKNHYLIYGLAPLRTSDPAVIAGESADYRVTVVHTFVDGLIAAITFGIYTPTTTIVTK